MDNHENTITPEEHLARWQGSGLSQKEYCRQNNVNANTFAYWRHRNSDKPIKVDPNWVRLHTKLELPMPERRLEIRVNLGVLRFEYVRVYP
jgi:transposase-like protein